MSKFLQVSILWLGISFAVAVTAAEDQPNLNIRLPEGFKIEVLVSGLNGARSMALSDNDTLFVGTMRKGSVYAVSNVFDDDRKTYTLAEKIKMPNGVAFHDGDLYVSGLLEVLRYSDIDDKLDNPGVPDVIIPNLSKKMLHGWKHIEFGPDGMLYLPQGSPCNVCDAPEFGTITRYNPDGSGAEVIARGIRNTVGMAWHPETEELWFTDNGRDVMGDDIPPDELNRLAVEGSHFGFPFCHGGEFVEPDPKLAALGSCADAVPPVQQLGAHVAALGLKFYTGEMFPEEYRNQIFIAEHGSWNRSQKAGYRISLVRLEGNKAVSYEPFAEGWLDNDTVNGRPVDLLVAPDGSLLMSDDQQGLVYRISYDSDSD